jgi:hypothetical protein
MARPSFPPPVPKKRKGNQKDDDEVKTGYSSLFGLTV